MNVASATGGSHVKRRAQTLVEGSVEARTPVRAGTTPAQSEAGAGGPKRRRREDEAAGRAIPPLRITPK